VPSHLSHVLQTQAFPTLYESDANSFIAAPSGAGKTFCAEFAILRAFAADADARCVYVTPSPEVARLRYDEWEARFGGSLGKAVVELTGELTSDLKVCGDGWMDRRFVSVLLAASARQTLLSTLRCSSSSEHTSSSRPRGSGTLCQGGGRSAERYLRRRYSLLTISSQLVMTAPLKAAGRRMKSCAAGCASSLASSTMLPRVPLQKGGSRVVLCA
jgi:hypothetical protein